MGFARFVILCLLFFINILHKSNNSLLSRSKNTYIYLPKLFDYVEPIDVDDIYNALREEVPGIGMFKNEIENVFKNLFNIRPQTGRYKNRNIFEKRKNRKKTTILSTQPPTLGRVTKVIWKKLSISSTQTPNVVRNWHYISRIVPTSTISTIFIIRPTTTEPSSSTAETIKSTSKINTAVFQFMPIPSSWAEDDNDDDDANSENMANYDETNEIIINFENYTYKIPYTTTPAATTVRKASSTVKNTTSTVKKTTSTVEKTTSTATNTTSCVKNITSTVKQSKNPNITIEQTTKRQLPDNYVIFNGTKKGECYRCGTDIDHTQNSLCHDIFNSNNYEYRSLAALLRATCYDNPSVRHGEKVKWPKRYDEFKLYQYTDQGLESKFYGSYSGGCFKRFLDIGNFYTQRGCRQWPPDGYRFRRGYFDHPTIEQYRRLEKKLGKSERDACVYSLHASLVPFARDVSLFARHHVCVCKGRYCNAASTIIVSFVSQILGVIYLIKYCCCYVFFYVVVHRELHNCLITEVFRATMLSSGGTKKSCAWW